MQGFQSLSCSSRSSNGFHQVIICTANQTPFPLSPLHSVPHQNNGGSDSSLDGYADKYHNHLTPGSIKIGAQSTSIALV